MTNPKTANVRYIGKTDDYWLTGLNKKGKRISVPYGLKVQVLEEKTGRVYFECLEGVNANIKADRILSLPISAKSYLTTSLMHRPAITVRFNLAKQTIFFGARGPFNAFSGGGHDGYTAVARGTYLLAIPAYPADAPRAAYARYAKKYRMWFRIGTSVTGSRFLHPGMISDGCVTVRSFPYDPSKKQAPPAGFADLESVYAKTKPGLVGLPVQNTDPKIKSFWKKGDNTLRPSEQQPIIAWDNIVDDLMLCRLSDQAIGRLFVT